MFGGRALMLCEAMLLSVAENGDLLLRVSAQRHDELIQRLGAHQAEMGPGYPMGKGWITVDPSILEQDEDLTFWVVTALERNLARNQTR